MLRSKPGTPGKVTQPAPRNDNTQLGTRVRELRRKASLNQADLAARLDISPSYLNLIEHDRRPLTAALLIRLAQVFEVDLASFASDQDVRLTSDLMEVFSDPLFDAQRLTGADVREFTAASPAIAASVLSLYRRYEETRASTESLAAHLSGFAGDEVRAAGSIGVANLPGRLPSEEVSDFIQVHMNYFPELEAAANRVSEDARSGGDTVADLVRYLEKHHGVETRIVRWDVEPNVVRRFDPTRRLLSLSELLPTRSRRFQLAHQIGLLTARPEIERLVDDPQLADGESKTLARMALASYFAGSVLMPYGPFLEAAQEARYDIDVIGRRFRVGFEQVCHRLTTLRKQGAEGVPVHMIRIDVAGNISKRFSASGIHFARFSGACPRWNVFAAFQTPGMIRIQLSTMEDGARYFCIARTVQKDSHGFHAQATIQAVGLGCRVEHARDLVYADGVDLANPRTNVEVGVTCRMCERNDCDQRAFPSMKRPLSLDENLRGTSIYAHLPRRPTP